jgi:hypothetical protein
MVRSIQKIEQELEAIATHAREVGERLKETYTRYLTVLGQSVQKQLVLASYQICTQAYPEAFLQLSLSQRQALQQSLRQLGDRLRGEFLRLLEMPYPPPTPENRDDSVSSLESPEELGEAIASNDPESDLEPPEISGEEIPPQEEETGLESPHKPVSEHRLSIEAIAPDTLVHWLKFLEQQIDLKLQTLSIDANQLLHEFGILPQELPAKLLEMAMQAEDSVATTSSSANLLNLLIETERDESDKESTVLQIAAVRLRLSEVEFADPTLSSERHKIRHLLHEVNQLGKQHQKKKREWAIAQAEAAWRASWYE